MNYYSTLALVLWAYMSLWFAISLFRKRNDVADVAWGLGFVLLAWSSFIFSGTHGQRALLANTLVSVWGLRLAWHIYRRNRGKTEDYRYLAWRREWGKWFYPRSYAQVYLLQGALLFLTALPALIINRGEGGPLGSADGAGSCIWLFGFVFEALGDAELARFVKNSLNRGKTLQTGLWRYTRHPNYFGEVVQWWGIAVLAFGVPGGWLGILGPVTITVLILKVSGIPMLEKRMSKNPDFADYKRSTNALFPWFPKNR